MGSIGPTEIVIVLLVVLLLFGAGRIADVGKGFGQAIKNFKQGIREADDEPRDAPALSPPASSPRRREGSV